MPNWCSNEVRLTFNSELIATDWKGSIDAEGSFLKALIPMPADIFTGDLNDDARAKHGDKNWYDWSLANWGTKWKDNIDFIERYQETIEIHFQTAWGPPIEGYERIQAHPALARVWAFYREDGMEFSGYFPE